MKIERGGGRGGRGEKEMIMTRDFFLRMISTNTKVNKNFINRLKGSIFITKLLFENSQHSHVQLQRLPSLLPSPHSPLPSCHPLYFCFNFFVRSSFPKSSPPGPSIYETANKHLPKIERKYRFL